MLPGHAVSEILLLLTYRENVKPPVDNEGLVCGLRTHLGGSGLCMNDGLLPSEVSSVFLLLPVVNLGSCVKVWHNNYTESGTHIIDLITAAE